MDCWEVDESGENALLDRSIQTCQLKTGMLMLFYSISVLAEENTSVEISYWSVAGREFFGSEPQHSRISPGSLGTGRRLPAGAARLKNTGRKQRVVQ